MKTDESKQNFNKRMQVKINAMLRPSVFVDT